MRIRKDMRIYKDITIVIKDYELTIDFGDRRLVQNSYNNLEEVLGEACRAICDYWREGER